MKRVVIYPGSFDPVTNGHLDVIHRAVRLFDEMIVAIALDLEKEPLFSGEERLRLVQEATRHIPHLRVMKFSGLLVDFAKKQKACALIRGLRAVSDFEFEFQMALMRRQMCPEIETLFVMPKDTYAYLSSRLIKEIARLGGDITPFVPAHVKKALQRKIRR